MIICLFFFDLSGKREVQQNPEKSFAMMDLASPHLGAIGSESNRYTFPFNKHNLPPGHHLISIPGNKKKECKYCQRHKIKTKSGYAVQTQYKCETCDVALCSGGYTDRNCLVAFHNEAYIVSKI